MKLTLVPRVAPPDVLRVWVGAQAAQAPTLTWSVDGKLLADTAVRALRPMASAIPQALAGGRASNFSGVYELRGVKAGKRYRATVGAAVGAISASAELVTSTLPAAVPGVFDKPFNVLLVSCFHQAEDRGQAAVIATELTGPSSPDLTLLLGDQVYLDLPTLANFPEDTPALARKFEADYRANWQSETGYARLLTLAPTASLPDDHEYWNNFPHASPIIQNSWKEPGRRNWAAAASALFDAFQFSYDPDTYLFGGPAQPGDALVIDVEPLSFFLADGRSKRDPDRAWVFTRRGVEQMQRWVADTIAKRRVGVFITGQSLLDPAASTLEGRVADYAMPNYMDFGRITEILGRISDAGLPLILVTGDVHWGRVARASDNRTGASIYEIISSPTSLVTSVGSDQWKSMWGAIKGGNDWPRHSDAADVSDFLWTGRFGKRFGCTRIHAQKGNHVVLLSFARNGAGVSLRTTYYPIHKDATLRKPCALEEISLRPV
jgi:hypothetical protein